MEDHFNENYMESTQFPKADFKGYIKNTKENTKILLSKGFHMITHFDNDYLLVSLSHNIKIFENITVVTSSDDLMCQKICEKFGVYHLLDTARKYDQQKYFFLKK